MSLTFNQALRTNLGRLSLMEKILDDDPDTEVDPWDDKVQPDKHQRPPLPFPRREVWEPYSDEESSVEDEQDRADEPKSVGKGAKTKANVPASAVEATPLDQMDVEDNPIVEPDPSAPSSPPHPPLNRRRSSRIRSQSPGPSSAVRQRPITKDVRTDKGLDDIEEDVEESTGDKMVEDYGDDKMPSSSNEFDLPMQSQVDSDRESRFSPLTLLPQTFPQLLRNLFRTTKVFSFTSSSVEYE